MTKSASESPQKELEPVQGAARAENRSQGQEGSGMTVTARITMLDIETLTEEQLKEIEARATVATPGPWQAEGGQIARREGEEKSELDHMIIRDGGMWAANELFIAHAREDIPALCLSLRAAWAELCKWEDNHDKLCLQREQMYRDVYAEIDALRRLVYVPKITPDDPDLTYADEVARLLRENAALGQQLATQAESITYFQENEKSLKAQLNQVEQE